MKAPIKLSGMATRIMAERQVFDPGREDTKRTDRSPNWLLFHFGDPHRARFCGLRKGNKKRACDEHTRHERRDYQEDGPHTSYRTGCVRDYSKTIANTVVKYRYGHAGPDSTRH